MKKYLMVIARYSNWRQEFFKTHMSPRNREYCQIHGFEYIEITEKLEPVRGKFGWIKSFKVQQLLKTTLQDGDILTCLDADMAKSKKTVAPKNWFSGPYTDRDTSDLYLPEWIII